MESRGVHQFVKINFFFWGLIFYLVAHYIKIFIRLSNRSHLRGYLKTNFIPFLKFKRRFKRSGVFVADSYLGLFRFIRFYRFVKRSAPHFVLAD